MAEPEVEAAWRAEFKRIGETQVRDPLNSITDETKRQAAFRWLGDEAEARRLREEQTHLLCPVDLLRRCRCCDRRPHRGGLNASLRRQQSTAANLLTLDEARRILPTSPSCRSCCAVREA